MNHPLVITSTLPEAQNGALEAHASVRLIRQSTPPWEPSVEAEALFTFQSQWKSAPRKAPEGWPFGLKWMQVASAGVDTLPDWALALPTIARGRGIQSTAIAEYVIAAVFAHEKRFWDGPVRERAGWAHKMLGGVGGKSIGIAGMGAIGAEVARLALGVDMKVRALTRRSGIAMAGVEAVECLGDLFAASDHLVLALPLTAETVGCVDRACLAAAKPALHLINVARGGIIDTPALIAALDAGQIAAATLDVTEPEPPIEGDILYSHPKIRLTPHVSGMSEQTDERMNAFLLGNIDRYLAGKPLQGMVDAGRRY